MRVTPIKEILTLAKDTPLDAVAGIVTGVFERKTGTGSFGPWAIQNIYIGDGNRTIKVMLRNSPEVVADGKGHKVYILAGIGKNGKPCGLKVAEDTYQGKTSIIVSANENATVTFDEPEALAGTEESAPATRSHPASEPASEPEMPDDVPMSYPPTQQQAQPVAHSTATKPTAAVPVTPTAPPVTRGGGARDTRSAWAQVDTGLNKLRRLILRTLACAIRIAEDMAASGHAVSPDHIEKIDSWMAIECCRNGLLAHVPDCDPPNITGE